MRSTSRLSACPAASFPSVVTARVCGTRSMSKAFPATRPTVRLTPSSATEPFSAMKRASPAGASMAAWRDAVLFPAFDHGRDAVHVARYEMTAEGCVGLERGLEVDSGTLSKSPECGARERLSGKFDLEAAICNRYDREADTGYGDAVADRPAGSCESAGFDRDPARPRPAADRGHSPHRLDDAGKHFSLSSLA